MWCGGPIVVAAIVTPVTPVTRQVHHHKACVLVNVELGMDTYRSSDDVLVLNIDMAFEILSNIEAYCSRIGNNKDEITFDIFTEMRLRLAIRYVCCFA